MSDSLRPHGLYSPWNSLGQNIGVGSLSLLQGIFPTQGLNPGILHCRWILYQLSHQGSIRLLEWVVYHFSSGFSQPRDQTRVSCIASGFFPKWVMREVVSLSLSVCMYIYTYILCYAKSPQSCPSLCDPRDSSTLGSPVPGILQARTLEWVAISFSSAWKWKEKVKSLSRVRLLATPWTAAHQAPPSMGFSRQVYWSGV